MLLSDSMLRLGSADAREVIDVLCEAFYDYPVMRFVLGASDDYAARLQELVRLFVSTRTMREDPIFGVGNGPKLVAAMTTSNPADPPHPDFAEVRAAAWRRIGSDAEKRHSMCVAVWQSIAVDVPQLHVNMIGVRDAYRGTGLARRLLEEIHADCDRSVFAQGVSLTTEVPRNVDFYRHMGYEVTGEARIADVLPTWHLFRPRSVQ